VSARNSNGFSPSNAGGVKQGRGGEYKPFSSFKRQYVSEYPVAICTSWACIYFLYHNNSVIQLEKSGGQYFLYVLLIACRGLPANHSHFSPSPSDSVLSRRQPTDIHQQRLKKLTLGTTRLSGLSRAMELFCLTDRRRVKRSFILVTCTELKGALDLFVLVSGYVCWIKLYAFESTLNSAIVSYRIPIVALSCVLSGIYDKCLTRNI